jgi:putative IMPACT (imprinted ancient) family translation regulator
MKRLDFSSPNEYIISKSTFISQLHDIGHKDDVHIIISLLKKTYPKAQHIAYGYILENEQFGSHDANEPKGTAGNPILDVLKHAHLNYVLCTVIRYFGGQLLGAAVLTKSYRHSASLAVLNASYKTLSSYDIYELVIPYTLYAQLKPKFLLSGIIQHEYFADDVRVELYWNDSKERLEALCYGVTSIRFKTQIWI